MKTGFRRRILIEPAPGRVSAELEDDYHRMVVTLHHAAGTLIAVDADMKRWPWTSCRGAIAQLRSTFDGVALADVVRRGEKRQNCTHLHDLAIFAAAHAEHEQPTAYDVIVSDPVDGLRTAKVARNGAACLDWRLDGDTFLSPEPLAGRGMKDLNAVIAGLDADEAEAFRILRWATILSLGRSMEIPAGLSATAFPGGSCFTFQPDRAKDAVRRPDADRDFSGGKPPPMADRADMF